MAFLKDPDRKQVSEMLANSMSGEVNLFVFYEANDAKCQYCGATVSMMKEVASLDKRIKLTLYDISKNQKEARFLHVDKVPAVVIGNDKRIFDVLYFGIPAGYEFSSLLEDIVDASNNATRLSEETKNKLKFITKPVDIKVFVTPTCPYCPKAVRIAHQFAMESKLIRASMIEAQEFMEMSQQYNVMGVPRTVINDTIPLEGAYPEEAVLQHVLKVGSE